jgi:hypothetical protein
MFLQSTILQWRTVFWIVFGVFLGTNVLFILMGSGELQPWNNHVPKKQGGEEECTSEQNPSTGKSRQCAPQHYTHTLSKVHTQSYRFLIVAYFTKFDWCSVHCLGFFYITFQKFGLFVELVKDPNLVGLSETANL